MRTLPLRDTIQKNPVKGGGLSRTPPTWEFSTIPWEGEIKTLHIPETCWPKRKQPLVRGSTKKGLRGSRNEREECGEKKCGENTPSGGRSTPGGVFSPMAVSFSMLGSQREGGGGGGSQKRGSGAWSTPPQGLREITMQ